MHRVCADIDDRGRLFRAQHVEELVRHSFHWRHLNWVDDCLFCGPDRVRELSASHPTAL